MEKKTKLTISGNTKKSIDNIELARLKNKNSVVIEKKPSRFSNNNPATLIFSSLPNNNNLIVVNISVIVLFFFIKSFIIFINDLPIKSIYLS